MIFGGNLATGLPDLCKLSRTSKNVRKPKFRERRKPIFFLVFLFKWEFRIFWLKFIAAFSCFERPQLVPEHHLEFTHPNSTTRTSDFEKKVMPRKSLRARGCPARSAPAPAASQRDPVEPTSVHNGRNMCAQQRYYERARVARGVINQPKAPFNRPYPSAH